MVNITLFEVHLDDSTFTANAPFSSASEDEADEAMDDYEPGELVDESDGGRPPVVPFVVGLLALIVIAAVARKVLGSDDEPVPEVEIDAEE